MKFWGKAILGNYDKKAKPVRITVKSIQYSQNQVWKGSDGVSGTLNDFREKGVKNSVTRCVMPSPHNSTSASSWVSLKVQ